MASVHTSTSVITIERFIMEQERLHPEATGELSNLLYDLCLAAKIISRHVRRAGLTDILGAAGAVNVSGDLQQKLDLFARDTVRNAVQHTGRVCVVASEEDEEPMLCPKTSRRGKYVIMYDPLDGSTNIDVNVSIGTIFSIHKRVTGPRSEPGPRFVAVRRWIEKIVPIETLTSMLLEPSSGSYSSTYFPPRRSARTCTGIGSSSSSEATMQTRPVCSTLWRTVSWANTSSFCCSSPCTLIAPNSPRMSVNPARRTWREMILAARQRS